MYTCRNCGIGLEYSLRDPVTAALHVANCKEMVQMNPVFVLVRISIARFADARQSHVEQASPIEEKIDPSKVAIARSNAEVYESHVEDDPSITVSQQARKCPVCEQLVIGPCGIPFYQRSNHIDFGCASICGGVRKGFPATDSPQMAPPPTPSLSKSVPAPAPATNIRKSSCLTCERDLANFSDVDALYHRAVCFVCQSNKFCPICGYELPVAVDHLPISLFHLHRCQRGNQDVASSTESDEFEALYMSLCGRTESLKRFFGRIEGKSRKGSSDFLSKIRRKRRHPHLLYVCGESTLRNCVNADGEDVECWRTAGDIGMAARNMFPVVEEDYDPFIVT